MVEQFRIAASAYQQPFPRNCEVFRSHRKDGDDLLSSIALGPNFRQMLRVLVRSLGGRKLKAPKTDALADVKYPTRIRLTVLVDVVIVRNVLLPREALYPSLDRFDDFNSPIHLLLALASQGTEPVWTDEICLQRIAAYATSRIKPQTI